MIICDIHINNNFVYYILFPRLFSTQLKKKSIKNVQNTNVINEQN